MFIKHFYFVRHGETILNAAHKRQGPEGALSENGRRQAEEVGARLTKINFKKILCSPYERTRETCAIINSFLKLSPKKIVFTDLLAERRNPSNIVGKSYDEKEAKEFIDTMDKSFHSPEMRVSDEENFQDLKDRAINLQDYLMKNGSAMTLCVTHGIFLKMFLSTLIYGKDLTVKDWVLMSEYNSADNAAITLVKVDTLKHFLNVLFERDATLRENNPWEILAYNDYTRDGNERLKI